MGEYLSIETAQKLGKIKQLIKFIKEHKDEIKYSNEMLKMLETKKEIKIWKEWVYGVIHITTFERSNGINNDNFTYNTFNSIVGK